MSPIASKQAMQCEQKIALAAANVLLDRSRLMAGFPVWLAQCSVPTAWADVQPRRQGC